jgi:glucose-1-phosphate cytidylyltransferase
MKAVILAGGYGTRISEETHVKPKPMIEIGGMPILWHIMKHYSNYGINDFVICCGYKGYIIKEYFANYFLHRSDVTFEPWKVTLVDTGLDTMTGGRLKKVESYLDNETFCFTYGDGISNINISESLKLHKDTGTIATVTAVQPPGKFGRMNLKENIVNHFEEKPIGDEGWINGGYFVLEPSVFKYLKDESTIWEREPLEGLAKNKQLSAYKHTGFWQPVDTLWDKNYLENIWKNNNSSWKI